MAPNFELDSKPRRHQSSAFKPIGDEGGLVVLPDRSEIKVLNPVGVRVFGLLDGTRTVAEIVALIFDEYDVPREKLLVDVQSFLRQLDANGMLAGSEETNPEVLS